MHHAGNGGGGASGRRANRTRFTDYQLKTLQEFFEKQAYPKDDDLEFLSKKMQLSPRVIVVWFQNARQKARKIYENQPNQESNDRFIKTPGCNYQCKRCNLVFQRYYELIQHQRKHCFKDAHWDDAMMIEGAEGGDMTSTSYQQGGLQCDQCSADFASVQLLEQHAKYHMRHALVDHLANKHAASSIDVDTLPDVGATDTGGVSGEDANDEQQLYMANVSMNLLKQLMPMKNDSSTPLDLSSPQQQHRSQSPPTGAGGGGGGGGSASSDVCHSELDMDENELMIDDDDDDDEDNLNENGGYAHTGDTNGTLHKSYLICNDAQAPDTINNINIVRRVA
ncbi:unnamed protein product [Sphagnum balticum]